MSSLMLSHSAKSLWLECPQKWAYRYINRIETVETAEPLIVGTAVHDAIEHNDPERILNAKELAPDLKAGLIALASCYRMAHPGDAALNMKLEQEFKVDIGNGLSVIIVVDGIGTDEWGQTFFKETKTTRSDISIGSSYWDKIHGINPQADLYFAVLRLVGIKPAYCLWDAMRVPALRRLRATPIEKREFYKRATGTAQVGDPKPGTYLEDESFPDFTKRVDATIRGDLGHYYRREIVAPNEDAISKVIQQIELVGHNIRAARDSGVYLRNTNACYSRREPCEFIPVCTGRASLADETLYQIRPQRSVEKEIF